MVLQQFALLNQQPIIVPNVGSIKSPMLKDIAPNNQENFIYYCLAMKIIFFNCKELAGLVKEFDVGAFDGWSQDAICSASKYDIILQSPSFAQFVCQAFGLFFDGTLCFVREAGFIVFDKDEKVCGTIDKNNYLMVEDLFRQLVHGESKYSENDVKYTSEKAKELWEKAKAFEEKNQSNVNSKDYDIGNIISKLCSCGIGYNVNNIYNLSVYQLYDQFSAYTQNRISRLSENAYAHWGGDSFDMNGWLRNN